MTTAHAPSYDLVQQSLSQLGAEEGVTEAHGSLCGLACVLGRRAPAVWVAALGGEGAVAEPGVLGDLATQTCAALDEGDMTFDLLLPPDDRPLAERAAALADWCAGFMHGLGEASGGAAAGQALGSETSREIISDFAEIARLTLGEDDTDLEAESAYSELVEFVRVSVQLLFEELYDVRQGLASAPVH